MSDKAILATDQTVGTWKCFLHNPNPSGKVVVPASILASLIARIEADGERMRELEGERMEVFLTFAAAIKQAGGCLELTPKTMREVSRKTEIRSVKDPATGNMVYALAALKEAPDA